MWSSHHFQGTRQRTTQVLAEQILDGPSIEIHFSEKGLWADPTVASLLGHWLRNFHSKRCLLHDEQLPRTLVYCDFYYENLIVHRDLRSAFVYDFDVSGTGIAATDIAHIEWYFTAEAVEALREVYGAIDETELLDR
jgi:hypothetical protein